MDEFSLIENELTISKEELQNMALKKERTIIFMDEKTFTANGYDADVCCDIWLTWNLENDKLKLIAEFSPLSEGSSVSPFCVGIEYYVKSANYSVACKKVIKVKCIHKVNDNQSDDDEMVVPFSTLTDILNPEKKFIIGGELTIHMKAIIFKTKITLKKNYPTLGSFLWTRDDRDFIISVGKENDLKTEINIHSYVLASRSEVFNRMLQTNMKEKVENKLVLNDFNANIVEAAVKCFYDQFDFDIADTDTLIGLLQFFEIYLIEDLKEKVAETLLFHIFPDRICQIANASVIHNSLDLKNFCIKALTFFGKNGIVVDNAENLHEDFQKVMETFHPDSEGDKHDENDTMSDED